MKIAIVCGSAECLWADIEAYKKLNTGIVIDIACINHTAVHFPIDFQFWISWHIDLFKELKDHVKCNPTTIGPDDDIWVDRQMNFPGFMASDSSLYAVKCLLEMGYDRIMLCGVPLDNTRKFYDAPDAELPQHASSNIQKAWKTEARGFADRVRSFSGNTRALLGAPTKEWLCL